MYWGYLAYRFEDENIIPDSDEESKPQGKNYLSSLTYVIL